MNNVVGQGLERLENNVNLLRAVWLLQIFHSALKSNIAVSDLGFPKGTGMFLKKHWCPLPSISSLYLCTRSLCSVGSMQTERILVGSRRLLPVSPKIIKCRRVSRNVTQFSFHSTFPEFPGNEKKTHGKVSLYIPQLWHRVNRDIQFAIQY